MYEQNLEENLAALAIRLTKDVGWAKELDFIGAYAYLPKADCVENAIVRRIARYALHVAGIVPFARPRYYPTRGGKAPHVTARVKMAGSISADSCDMTQTIS